MTTIMNERAIGMEEETLVKNQKRAEVAIDKKIMPIAQHFALVKNSNSTLNSLKNCMDDDLILVNPTEAILSNRYETCSYLVLDLPLEQ